jgi:hypothetical protein
MHDADGEDRRMQSYDLCRLQDAHLLGVYGCLRHKRTLLCTYDEGEWWLWTWTWAIYELGVGTGGDVWLNRIVDPLMLLLLPRSALKCLKYIYIAIKFTKLKRTF